MHTSARWTSLIAAGTVLHAETPSPRAGAELKYRHTMKFLSRLQFRRRELGVVRRVREMLGLQIKCESWLIHVPLLAGNRPIEVIPRIELHSRLGREHSQNASARGLILLGRLGQLFLRMIQNEVVIVAQAQPQLLIVGVDPLP